MRAFWHDARFSPRLIQTDLLAVRRGKSYQEPTEQYNMELLYGLGRPHNSTEITVGIKIRTDFIDFSSR